MYSYVEDQAYTLHTLLEPYIATLFLICLSYPYFTILEEIHFGGVFCQWTSCEK